MAPENELSLDGNRYAITGRVRRVQINDWPRPTPNTGAQDVGSRYLRNQLVVKDIADAFSHQVELRWEDHIRNSVVIMDHLADSECWTHQGIITKRRRDRAVTAPAVDGISWVAGPRNTDATSRPSTATGSLKNPRMPKFYEGTARTGVYVGRTDDVGANDYDLQLIRWTGTAWTEEEEFVATASTETEEVLDIEEHKGALHVWYVTGSGVVEKTTDGTTFSALANSPATGYEGSRLLSDGNLIYAFIADTTPQFDISSTNDDGASAWVAGLSNASGQVRDVGFFFDRDDNSRIVVLTESALYWLNTTTQNALVLNKILDLPYRGRAMLEFAGELIIFMDHGKVYAYSANGALRNVSPGGNQGMPSGKDFGNDSDGQVCIVRTATGIYALWSGADTGGTDLKPLILIWTGRGWHFIWRRSATSISSAARFIAFDPISGDLLWGIQNAVSEATELMRIADAEAPVSLLGSSVEFADGTHYFEMPRLDFGSPAMTTTLWDCFLNTDDVDSTEIIYHWFGIDGDVSTDQDMGTVTADDSTFTYPVSGSAGVNCRTFQARFALRATGWTGDSDDHLSPKIISISFSYLRVPDVRWVYSFEVDIPATFALRDPAVRGEAIGIRNALETTLDSKVKVTLAYGDRTGLSVLPIPSAELSEDIIDSIGPVGGRSQPNVVTVFLAEV